MSDGLTVLFEDNHCLAVAKPAPQLTQAPPGVPSLESQVKAYLKERYRKKGNVYLGIPHRLDRPVTGVVLFARSTKAARRLAEQFQQRQALKVYWMAVEGTVQPESARWEDWLLKLPEQARSACVLPSTPGARKAVLTCRVLGEDAAGSVVEVRPETGRMHQIRVQAAVRGHPIRGDHLYGALLPFGPPALMPRDRVIGLHARNLTFLHPIRYEPVHLTAPLPETWSGISWTSV
jgi:23S rRNA pseudouridine1911/1915/1917 synthase